MRKYALVGLFAITIFALHSPKASARSLAIINLESPQQVAVLEPSILGQIKLVQETELAKPQPDVRPEPQKYKVAENDTLSTIAASHGTTWKRIYDKNESITHPDIIKVNEELIIPTPEEQLPERPTPVLVPKEQPKTVARAPVAPRAQATVRTTGSTAGNKYVAGYCTWYVKNKRPSLPNNLGNAYAWVSNAAAWGMATGSTPQVGAVGQAGNHVVYVESVNSDGTVTISEMNHTGLYVITTRTLPATYFKYIY